MLVGHLIRKIVSAMTYNVSSGTLNSAVLIDLHFLFPFPSAALYPFIISLNSSPLQISEGVWGGLSGSRCGLAAK